MNIDATEILTIPDSWAVHEGDSLAVLARLPTASCDALVTDHPYSSGGMVRGDRTGTSTRDKYSSDRKEPLAEFSGDNRDQRSYTYWCALWLSECLRIVKPGGVGLLFSDWRQLPSTTDAFQAGGWIWRGVVPWVKPRGSFRSHQGRFDAACEYVIWGSNGVLPIVRPVPALPGFYPCTPPPGRGREHITQKPVGLMSDLLAVVEPGGVVLDPFCGSGTTGVAAVSRGLRFVGCEIVATHAKTARDRLGRASGERVDAGEQVALL